MIIVDLRKVDLMRLPLGSEVITSKGFSFKLISRDEQGKEEWLDLTSYLVWGSVEEETYTFDKAMEKFKDRLPTINQFVQAELHGFREVLSIMHGWCFWSSSALLTASSLPVASDDSAYIFNVHTGYVTDYERIYPAGNVICVRQFERTKNE